MRFLNSSKTNKLRSFKFLMPELIFTLHPHLHKHTQTQQLFSYNTGLQGPKFSLVTSMSLKCSSLFIFLQLSFTFLSLKTTYGNRLYCMPLVPNINIFIQTLRYSKEIPFIIWVITVTTSGSSALCQFTMILYCNDGKSCEHYNAVD